MKDSKINWKMIVKNIILHVADEVDDIFDFKTKIKKEYGLDSEALKELGIEYILEINNSGTHSVHLFADKDDAIDKLKSSWQIFKLSHKTVNDEYIRPDDMYAYAYTSIDDLFYIATIENV